MKQTKLFNRAALCLLAYLSPAHGAAEADALAPRQAADQEQEKECHIAAFVEKLQNEEFSENEEAREAKEKPRHHNVFDVATFVWKIEKGLLKPKNIKRDMNKHNRKLEGMRKRRRCGQIRKPVDCNKDTPAIHAAGHKKPKALEVLIKHGADLEKKNELGATALISAAASGSLECVKLLVGAKADLYAQDDQGQTALMHAQKTEASNQKQAALMRSKKAQALSRRCNAIVELLMANAQEANFSQEVDLAQEVDADANLELTWV